MSESGGGNAGDLQSNCAPNPLKGAKHIKIMGLKSHSGGQSALNLTSHLS